MMPHHVLATRQTRLRIVPFLTLGLLSTLVLSSSRSDAAPPRPFRPFGAAQQKPVAPPAPRSALLTVEAWQKAPLTPVQAGEIDQLVAKELTATQIKPAPQTTDEQFIRRVSLDLTGQLPKPAAVNEFVADQDPQKRSRLIDRLLDSPEYARHWAAYWRSVLTARSADRRAQLLVRSFDEWMTKQLQSNQSWADIATAMITAEGQCRFDNKDPNGAAFFLASHIGTDSITEQAAETSRVFLGIQIQCAQCHDHPSDQWKRVQFHELAGYFARVRSRPVRDGKQIAGIELVSLPRGEHEMPSKDDPKTGLTTPPRFLTGETPGPNATDKERRRALAKAITDKNNYWFAGAYVNRIWGVLMGQSFYQPIDDMGPQKEAVFPTVLTRLTGSFRGSNYDMKALFRDVMNSQTYQRQIRLSESGDQHLHFAAAYPTRLSADSLWQSLTGVLGNFDGFRPGGPFQNRYGFRFGMEGLFKLEFDFDPSLKADDVEGSISQALLMMNNPAINQRMQARGPTLLAEVLKTYPEDDAAVRALYLRTLARKPTARELAKCQSYIKKTGDRAEAFEDLLWALINSTEFQTRR
jgi:hypothetical protein